MASRAWAWFRANAAPLGVGTGVVGVFACYATETHRMARQIRRGCFQPKAPADYDHRFCPFDRYMMEKAKMVGLVGLKSTGKSSTLSHFLREKPNPFYLELTDGNLYDAMYDKMKHSVLRLPFFADHLRWDAGKNSKTIVIEVFELVQEQTGSPVQVGVDVVLNPSTLPVEGADKAVKTVQGVLLGTASSVPFFRLINIIKLVKDVKWLCADARVASAVIASSEGLELLSVNEPRLVKLMAKEMPLEKAKEYLQHIHAKGYTEEMLKNIPRTFESLQQFKIAEDKEDFCQKEMEVWIKRVEESQGHCSNEGKDGGLTAAKALYSKALGGAVNYRDICQHCKDEPNFTANFVRPNLFTPTAGAKYKFQFDCVAEAAKIVFGP
ncbi:unnamed protein product [Symbiodinium sp. CCMP2456]|nr:unnamed protein product [Symbiodinium sp. CCMP2456]